jgi:hypothetical protein
LYNIAFDYAGIKARHNTGGNERNSDVLFYNFFLKTNPMEGAGHFHH